MDTKMSLSLVGVLICLTANSVSSQELPEVTAYVPIDGGTNKVSDFERVAAPQFLLAQTGVDGREVELLCSRLWSGVIARVDGVLGAMNSEASAALKRGMTADYGGQPAAVVAADDPYFRLAKYPTNVSRLVERANKQCHPEGSVVSLDSAPQGSVESAYAVCGVVDAAKIASSPCEVSGWDSAVKMTIDVRAGEARQICDELTTAAQQRKWIFGRGWTIQIFSPYSGDKPIAYCTL